MEENIDFRLNGEPVSLKVDPERKLLWVLRGDLQLTGSKYGCGKGQCGSCTVIVDKRAVRSCLVTVKSVVGKDVLTIEGLVRNGELNPVQKAFIENDALQCGICTPGMIMNAYALLLKNPEPSTIEIVRGMEGNLCRCGAYKRIILAVKSAAEEMKGGLS